MHGGTLEVGITPDGKEIVINHPDLPRDEHGVAHIIFSPDQARTLAHLLEDKADEIQLVIPTNSTDPKQMREDSLMWSRAGYPQVAVGRYRDAAARIEQLNQKVEMLMEALGSLYPGLVLDLRYAEPDDDRDAMQSRIDTVREALEKARK